MGRILVGITSWTEPTLIESGRFYPKKAMKAEERLRFYASQFPIVEVDSTYYSLPSEANSALWVHRTPDDFIFDIKAFRLFTMHPTPPLALPKDLREALPGHLRAKKSLYLRELPTEIVMETWQRFARALLPLDSAGKLGVILFQFPPWFYPGDEEREYITICQAMLPQYRVAVEFRSGSWLNEKNIERTLAFLRAHNLAFVCVDGPQGFKSSVPPIAEATSDIGVVRYHGRNAEAWEKPGLTTAQRFDYIYSEAELGEWLPKIKQLAEKTKQLHVLFNNCYADKSVVNASQVKLAME